VDTGWRERAGGTVRLEDVDAAAVQEKFGVRPDQITAYEASYVR